MSTILDALEKANRDKARAAAERLGAGTSSERALREEAERHRKRARLLALAMGAVVVLALIVVAVVLMTRDRRMPPPPTTDSATVAAPAPQQPPAQGTVAAVQPPPAPVEFAPTPTPLPTPAPTAAPSPTASPTPVPSPTPAPTRRFTDNQVIAPDDLGVSISGVFTSGGTATVIIDGEPVDIGRRHKGIRPLSINQGLIEAEVDDAGTIVTVYIRY